MPSPLVGRKIGVGTILPPQPENVKGTRVVGISGSSREQAGLSKSERLLLAALDRCKDLGCETKSFG